MLTSQLVVGIGLPIQLPNVLEAVEGITLVTSVSTVEDPSLWSKLKVHDNNLYDVLESFQGADDVGSMSPGERH